MGGTIKIRFPNELWWDEVSYESALKWVDLEINRKDYDKIMNQKAFRLKFKLKKHEIL